MTYIDVIVPLPLSGIFTYSLPENIGKVRQGSRVIVQFGKKKFYAAVAYRIYESEEVRDYVKEIISVLDDEPIILPQQIRFWEWIASYYMCTIGEVYKAALPSALKLESETSIIKNASFEGEQSFSPNETKLFYALPDEKPIKVSDIQRQAGISNLFPYIKSLIEKGAIAVSEDINNAYSAKYESAVRLKSNFSEEQLIALLDTIKRAKKQHELLLFFLDKKGDNESFFIKKKDLLLDAGVSSAVLDGLVEKEIFEVFPFEVSRFEEYGRDLDEAKALNPHQEKAYEEIKSSFSKNPITLLHGVTSSGKTEIYIQLIKDAVEKGEQVLYLLPEIALTTQITQRLKSVFGDRLMVYHSRFNDNERAETWLNLVQKGDCHVVLGARSSVFLPFKNLGLIIVDEEHESSYKQQDPAPRYNARNAAMYLANMYGAKTLLGTATPSIETYYLALSGRYNLVELKERYANISLPEIRVVNTKDLRRRKQMKHFLSPPLIDEVKDALSKKEQIILFQNRRGFAPLLECKTCSWTRKCDHCDVSLTYHKWQNILSCHYCGAAYPVVDECPECKTPTLEVLGYGTERIEEEVGEILPEASTLRMDLDTTRSKKAYERIISDFAANKSDILIGTQMVSKGLDFENVSIVGILNADTLLNYPDFRAHEKAFQMLTQVSGRAGRKNKQGKVILQTSHPDHPIIQFVKSNDYQAMYEMQMAERRLFRYPPFYRLISIVMRGRDESLLERASQQFANLLKQSFGDRVLGATKPAVGRVQALYIRNILLKIENTASPNQVRSVMEHYKKAISDETAFRSILIHFDVDPM